MYRRRLWQTYILSWSLSLPPPVTLAQAQDWTSCTSLQHYVNEHPNCYIRNNSEPCSGLNCHYEDSDVTNITFYISKCEDPVTVNVYVELYNGEYADYEYSQSETFHLRGYSFSAILERNATHLAFMVSLYWSRKQYVLDCPHKMSCGDCTYHVQVYIHTLIMMCVCRRH